ncbi:hypothetical protein KSP40_PGU020161 [Platanthera guangdongensis]|uniref:Uncharacterized protein n=1 Tax=Platanthera guangdongensis TaxID=2320717 RepID=A0ABR2LI72_9ASPA
MGRAWGGRDFADNTPQGELMSIKCMEGIVDVACLTANGLGRINFRANCALSQRNSVYFCYKFSRRTSMLRASISRQDVDKKIGKLVIIAQHLPVGIAMGLSKSFARNDGEVLNLESA